MNLPDILAKLVYDGFEAFGRYYSSYPGFVIQNEDPEGMQRLILKIPVIASDQVVNIWALPKGMYGGEGHGVFITPSIGDMVWVSFRNGNPKFPMWSFGYKRQGLTPKELNNPKLFWFQTPSGILVKIDDVSKEISTTHPDGMTQVIRGKEVFIGDKESTSQYVPLGKELVQQLTKEKLRVDLLYTALTTSPTTPNDGGAAYKAGITQTLSPAQAPDYTDILSKQVKIN